MRQSTLQAIYAKLHQLGKTCWMGGGGRGERSRKGNQSLQQKSQNNTVAVYSADTVRNVVIPERHPRRALTSRQAWLSRVQSYIQQLQLDVYCRRPVHKMTYISTGRLVAIQIIIVGCILLVSECVVIGTVPLDVILYVNPMTRPSRSRSLQPNRIEITMQLFFRSDFSDLMIPRLIVCELLPFTDTVFFFFFRISKCYQRPRQTTLYIYI